MNEANDYAESIVVLVWDNQSYQHGNVMGAERKSEGAWLCVRLSVAWIEARLSGTPGDAVQYSA